MVIDDAAPPSRAASLTLVGGELALDFANTSSGRGWREHQEHLRSCGDIVDWAARARVLSPDEADGLREATRADPDLGRGLFDAALALREDVYALSSEIAAGRAAPPEHTERLTQTHAHFLARAQLAPVGGNFAWNWSTKNAPIEAVLGRISLSALTILLQADLTRIKQCPGDKCGWLFLDATKNKSRRWCEMEICGNRAKQKRFGAKARGA